MLYFSVDVLTFSADSFSGRLTHCKSSYFSGSNLADINSGSGIFFIANGDFSINFIALNKPGGVSK